MTTIVLLALFFAGQRILLQDPPIAHLPPHTNSISINFGGKLLELIDAPSTLLLPKNPPGSGRDGERWMVEVRNLGPDVVTLTGRGNFSVSLNPGRTVHVVSNGSVYSIH